VIHARVLTPTASSSAPPDFLTRHRGERCALLRHSKASQGCHTSSHPRANPCSRIGLQPCHQSLRPSVMTLAARSRRQPAESFSVIKVQSYSLLHWPLAQMSANPSPRYMYRRIMSPARSSSSGRGCNTCTRSGSYVMCTPVSPATTCPLFTVATGFRPLFHVEYSATFLMRTHLLKVHPSNGLCNQRRAAEAPQ